MARISPAQFRRWFDEILQPADEVVVVYSGIWSFGSRFGLSGRDLPRMLIEQMLESVGPQRTLLLPAYTPSYTRTRSYSPQDSLPETGILPQTCLREFAFLRTRSALDSFLAIGPQAKALAQVISPTTLWGEGCLKQLFEPMHARLVTLGLPWKESLGTLHRIEEIAQVPYRYYKTFHGKWLENDLASPWQETMFVRSIDVVPKYLWSKVDDLLRERGRIPRAGGDVFIESADAADIVSAGLELIASDPYALLANADAMRDWVQHGKASEIEALRAREPAALDYHDRSRALLR